MKRPIVPIIVLTMLLALIACGPQGGRIAPDRGSAVEGTGKLDGGGRTLVVFMPTTSDVYMAADLMAIKKEAKALNFTVKTFENNLDQAEQNQQVQEWIATGEDAAAILFWPSAGEAATNSIRLLSKKAPVIQFNQGVQKDAEEFVTAYAGVSDLGIGEQAGKNALKSIERRKDEGAEFHGPDGKPNLVEFRFPTGYVAGDQRHEAFAKTTRGEFNELVVEPANSTDAQSGYKAASQIVPKFKSEGIDYIFAQNNNMATGVVQALEQNGLTPGQDVVVVAGDYSGDKDPLRQGKIESAVIQSPVLEGMLVVDTAAQYLATGDITDGDHTLPTEETKPELGLVPPHATTFMMNPPVTADTYDSTRIWGMTVDELVK